MCIHDFGVYFVIFSIMYVCSTFIHVQYYEYGDVLMLL